MRTLRPLRTHARMPMAATFLVAVAGAATCSAGTLEVKVADERGEPVAHVAVYATPATATAPAKGRADTPRTAVMDQQHNEFVPKFLIVTAGTSVQFPNHDAVSHHVYSFSPAKTFELALYKGNVYPPLVFDRPGVIVLGCNIHDSMLGYILVVPTEHYTLTDERGVARLEDLPPGEYTLEAWTPRARATNLPPAQHLVVADAAKADMRIAGRLSPESDRGSKSLSWDRY